MSNNQQPRRLNTGGARGSGSGSGNSGSQTRRTVHTSSARTVYTSSARGGAQSGARPAHSASSRGTSSRSAAYHGTSPRSAPAHSAPRAGGKKKKKRGCGFYIFVTLLVVLVLVIGAFAGVYHWVMSNISPDDPAQAISEEIRTAEEYRGDVVNVLVCGIDYEEGRNYSNDAESNDGMTDMILYVNFDVKNKKVNMLQIPRDTFVGEIAGSTGKINAVALRNDGIPSLAKLISEQLQLPVDYYATIDMQSLKEIVDLFGGIEVYVPHDISYKGSLIQQGVRTLDGDAAEFFVRCRYGEGYANSDIDRLNMQCNFYSALFREFRTLTVPDLIKMVPVAVKYLTTDMPATTMASVGLSLLQVDSADMLICQMPVYNGQPYGSGKQKQSVVVADPVGTADLLNTYFRTYGEPVSADQLQLASWGTTSSTPTNPNVQYMGQLDADAEAEKEANGVDN